MILVDYYGTAYPNIISCFNCRIDYWEKIGYCYTFYYISVNSKFLSYFFMLPSNLTSFLVFSWIENINYESQENFFYFTESFSLIPGYLNTS